MNSAFTIDELIAAYFDTVPDPGNPAQRVSFGTSGHRGSSLNGSFTEQHILAVTRAVCDYRRFKGINGPLFMGRDTHALSGPAQDTALEVLAACGVKTLIQAGGLPTPTPVVSYSVIMHNAFGAGAAADGIVITPSHNPPEDGGFKYNEPHGGPAGEDVTAWIEKRANAYLAAGNKGVERASVGRKRAFVEEVDHIGPYVRALGDVVDMRAVAASGLRLGADPLGGSSLPVWERVAAEYGLALTVVNTELDPLFRFMPPDHDGKIRMDCSSPQAMAGLIRSAAGFDLAFGNDPDADRHGIVTPKGLMNPNHYLAAAVDYLLRRRPGHPAGAAVGKTCVGTVLINRICARRGAALYETPVGFKWFVEGLANSTLRFGGEESAGASFLRRDGKVWTTDKDGIILNLLAAEMTAVTGGNPQSAYEALTREFGETFYSRVDAPATAAEKDALKRLTPEDVRCGELAGEPVTGVLTRAPGNDRPIGGVKVETAEGWFAARPSGTEDLYKIYAESFVGPEHLQRIKEEAQELVGAAFAGITG
jgi:phosphoglucomutase